MKKTYFSRILLTYSVTVCVLISLVFSGFVLTIQSANRRQIERYSDESFLSYLGSYEQALSNLFDVARNVKSMDSLDLFALSSNAEYYQRMTRFYTDLRRLSSYITNGGYHVIVHKVNDETVITNHGTNRLSAVLEEMGLSGATYREILSSLADGRQYDEKVVFTDDNLIYVSQKDYVDSKVILVLYAPVSSLKLYPTDPGLPVSLVVDDAAATDLRERTKPDAPAFAGTEGAEAHELYKETIGGVQYTWSKSSLLNLIYYYYPLPGDVLASTAKLLAKMVALLLAVCAVAFGVIMLFSVRLYRPIDRLVNTLLSYGDGADAPSPDVNNEMEYIARQVAAIRSDNRELTKKLSDNLRLLREEVVGSLIEGTYHPETVGEELRRAGLEWLDGPAALVLLEADAAGRAGGGTEPVARMLDEQMEQRFTVQRFLAGGGLIGYLVREADEETLREALGDIITVVDTAFQLPLCAYIGPPSEEVRQIHASFVAAGRVMENKRRLPYRSVYSFRDCAALPAENAVYPLRDESLLVSAVERGDAAQTRRLLDGLFDEYVARAFDSKERREQIIFALINTVNRALQQSAVELRQITEPGELIFLEMKLCHTPQALHSYVTRLFERILREGRSFDERRAESFKERLQEFISENLQKDISLLDLAEHFSLSPNYMSALFKSTMEDNFKDYLSKRRFERAVEILRADPSCKLAVLGEQVGIANVNTLIRLFKKFSGLSPGQYSREHFPQKE